MLAEDKKKLRDLENPTCYQKFGQASKNVVSDRIN